MSSDENPLRDVRTFLGVTFVVSIYVVAAIVTLVFMVSGSGASNPSGTAKVLGAVLSVLMFPGEMVKPIVGGEITIISAVLWGMVAASIHMVTRRRPAAE